MTWACLKVCMFVRLFWVWKDLSCLDGWMDGFVIYVPFVHLVHLVHLVQDWCAFIFLFPFNTHPCSGHLKVRKKKKCSTGPFSFFFFDARSSHTTTAWSTMPFMQTDPRPYPSVCVSFSQPSLPLPGIKEISRWSSSISGPNTNPTPSFAFFLCWRCEKERKRRER